MADNTVEEMLADLRSEEAAMSPDELAAHRAKIIADQLAHARANPYTGGERQAQAEIPKGLVVVADTDHITAEIARAAIASAERVMAENAALRTERDAALDCVAIEATARGTAEARVVELEGLAAQDAYLILPTDRGGPTGPKGTASYKFMQAMAELRAALAKEEPKL